MASTAPEPLYVLAFDHRETLKRMLDLATVLPPAEAARLSEAKRLVLDSLLPVPQPADEARIGFLVDEELGAAEARAAKAAGLALAMPVERSEHPVFEFEYGADFRRHVEMFEPDYVKSLIRWNPGDPDRDRAQLARMRELNDWTAATGRTFMLEVIVPPTDAQLAEAGGPDGYQHDILPRLLERAVVQLCDAGILPDLWKIEGLDTTDACADVVAACRTYGKPDAGCIVLGRGADVARVDRWLATAGATPGYIGFAVGRTIWMEPVLAFLRGELDRDEAVRRVRANFDHCVDVFTQARSAVPVGPARELPA